MNSDLQIPIAEMRTIYQLADVEKAREESAPGQNESLSSLYDKMRKLGGERFAVRPSSTDPLDSLYDRCPNFAPVIDDLKKYAALAVSGHDAMSCTPILLLGEPGIGKTHFAKQLADTLGTGYEFVSMCSLTAGWVLSGASSQWNHAKPGRVAQTLVEGDYANPVIVLDRGAAVVDARVHVRLSAPQPPVAGRTDV